MCTFHVISELHIKTLFKELETLLFSTLGKTSSVTELNFRYNTFHRIEGGRTKRRDGGPWCHSSKWEFTRCLFQWEIGQSDLTMSLQWVEQSASVIARNAIPPPSEVLTPTPRTQECRCYQQRESWVLLSQGFWEKEVVQYYRVGPNVNVSTQTGRETVFTSAFYTVINVMTNSNLGKKGISSS